MHFRTQKLFKNTIRNYIAHCSILQIIIKNITLKEYIKLWEKIRDLIGKKFDGEPVYGDKYIKTEIKSYNNDIRTNFHGEDNSKKLPKESCTYKCLSLISLDSIIKMGKKHYPQTLLEECKYKLTNKKVEDLITDDIDSSSESDS